MASSHTATAEVINRPVLDPGFDLNLLAPDYITLLRHQTTSILDRNIEELKMVVLRIRITLKKEGVEWNYLQLWEQQRVFRFSCEKIRVKHRKFRDTQECMAELHRLDESVDRDIGKGKIKIKNIPTTEQNTGNTTEAEPGTPTVAPQANFAGADHRSNGLTAGAQHQRLLRRRHTHTPSPLRQSNGLTAGAQHQRLLRRRHTHTPSPLRQPKGLTTGAQHQRLLRRRHTHTPSPLRQSTSWDEL